MIERLVVSDVFLYIVGLERILTVKVLQLVGLRDVKIISDGPRVVLRYYRALRRVEI